MESDDQKPKILFVCHQNKVRSLTAEQLYRNRPDLDVRSAGTAGHAKTRLTRDLLDWADLVFVFDNDQIGFLETTFPDLASKKQVVCLGLPDKFDYKGQDLIVKLVAKLDPYLGRPESPPKHGILPVKTIAKRNQETSPDGRKSLTRMILKAVGLKKIDAILALCRVFSSRLTAAR